MGDMSFRQMDNWIAGYDKLSSLKLGVLTKIQDNASDSFGTMVNTGRPRGLCEFFSNQFTLGRVASAATQIVLNDGSVKWAITASNSGILIATSGSGADATTLTMSSPNGTKWDITITSGGILVATSGSSSTAVNSVSIKSASGAYWVLTIDNSGILSNTVTMNVNSIIMCAQCTTDYSVGKMSYMLNNTWYAVKNTSNTDLTFLPYHVSFSQYYDSFRNTNTLYFCNGDTLSKFFTDITVNSTDNANNQAVTLSDTAGSATALTGTLTFNADKTVTGSGTSFTTEVQKGRWIRKSNATSWEEVAYVVSDTSLVLRSTPVATGAGSAGGSEIAPLTSLRPLFCTIWKDKLWLLNLFNGPNGAVYSRLICSDTWSSSTPWSLETFTNAVGNTAGYLDIRMQDVSYGTGMVGVGDYLFVFSENEYIVYRFDTTYTPAISEVRRFRFGCNSADTIKVYGYSVIYFTGKEYRMTDGINDVSISDDIKPHILYNADVSVMTDYFGLSSADDKYPCAMLDSFNMQYKCWLNDASGTDTRFEYVYDLLKGEWISGVSNNYNVAKAIQTFSLNSSPTTNKLNSSYVLYLKPMAESTLRTIFFSDSGTQSQGTLMTQDMWFDDVQADKSVEYIDMWFHVPNGLTVTFDFQFYSDGVAKYPTAISRTITGTADDQLTKIRFVINSKGKFFRWRLRDTAYSGTATSGSSVTIVPGVIKYTTEEGK